MGLYGSSASAKVGIAAGSRGSACRRKRSKISSRVKTALLADSSVKGTAVEVESFRGVVQLSGFVDNQEMANRAVAIAKGVPGVREVKNDMRLRPRG